MQVTFLIQVPSAWMVELFDRSVNAVVVEKESTLKPSKKILSPITMDSLSTKNHWLCTFSSSK